MAEEVRRSLGREYFSALWRWWWLLVATVAFSGGHDAVNYLLGLSGYRLDMPRWVGLALGGSALLVAQFLAFAEMRRQRNEAEAELHPRLHMAYDRANSLITRESETYRLRIWNSGVKSIDEVRLRVRAVPTAPHALGLLPLDLREQHTESGGPFVLNANAPRYIDFIEYADDLAGRFTTDAEQRLMLLCAARNSGRLGVEPVGTHEIEVELEGRDVPSCRKRFAVRSLLPQRGEDGAALEISETSWAIDAKLRVSSVRA